MQLSGFMRLADGDMIDPGLSGLQSQRQASQAQGGLGKRCRASRLTGCRCGRTGSR
jgi:hypothetical protein